jgi:hypothetical protein
MIPTAKNRVASNLILVEDKRCGQCVGLPQEGQAAGLRKVQDRLLGPPAALED